MGVSCWSSVKAAFGKLGMKEWILIAAPLIPIMIVSIFFPFLHSQLIQGSKDLQSIHTKPPHVEFRLQVL